MARVVALAECGTHAIFAASVGTYKQSEAELSESLLTHLDQSMLLIADRGFFSMRCGAKYPSRVRTCCGVPGGVSMVCVSVRVSPEGTRTVTIEDGVWNSREERRRRQNDAADAFGGFGRLDDVLAKIDAGQQLTGESGLLGSRMKAALERGLNAELTEHLVMKLGDRDVRVCETHATATHLRPWPPRSGWRCGCRVTATVRSPRCSCVAGQRRLTVWMR